MNSNPVLVILNGLAATVALVLVALNALGVTHLDPGATTAVVAAVAGVCNLVGLAIRAAVVPVGRNAKQVAQALATPTRSDRIIGLDASDPMAAKMLAQIGTTMAGRAAATAPSAELAAAQAQTERQAAGA